MAVRFIDSFDLDYATTHAVRKYAVATGGGTSAAGRIFGNAVTNGGVALVRRTTSFGVQNELVVGFGIFIPSNFTSGATGLYLLKGALEQVSVRLVNTAGSFNVSISRAGTQLGVTTNNFAYGIWHFFEVKITPHTASGAFEIRHDEVSVLTGTGLNTANVGTNGADVFELNLTAAASGVRIDDLYVLDTTGAAPTNDFLGDVTIEAQLPDADGTPLEWSVSAGTHFSKVDDPAGAPVDGTDVIFSDTNGQRDFFGFPNLTQTQGQIFSVMLNQQCAMNTAGSRVLRHKFRTSGGTIHDGSSFTVTGTTYGGFQQIWDLNPDTAAAWTNSDIDSGTFGVEVVS